MTSHKAPPIRQFYNWKNYEIDFAKVKSLEDVIMILRSLEITISTDPDDPKDAFKPLMPYLKDKS